MNTPYMAVFFSGVSMATFAASGLFFYKFWRASHDRFFLFFMISCELLALERLIALYIHGTLDPLRSSATEAASWIYCVRLLAFVILLYGILDKNRSNS